MAIDWAGVKALLDSASQSARNESSIDDAMNVYNDKVIEALQLMASTASVDGGTCVDGGPVTAAAIS